jgi:aminoglycoside 3-N-acetyltransferase
MPPFDPVRTPASRTLGRIAEEVRTTPGAVRSAHPQTSFAALGPAAGELMGDHPLACHLGERSPTHRLYRAGARALLIGVPVWCCTPLHLAEYWQPVLPPMQRYGCVVTDGHGRRQWAHFDDLPLTDRHFAVMGDALAEQMTDLVTGPFGDAPCFLFPIAEGVDLATKWLLNRSR